MAGAVAVAGRATGAVPGQPGAVARVRANHDRSPARQSQHAARDLGAGTWPRTGCWTARIRSYP